MTPVPNTPRHEVDVATVGETARTAAQRMQQRRVGCVVVVDREDRPIGILTDRDLALRVVAPGLNPLDVLVGDIMTRSPTTAPEDATPDRQLSIMKAARIRRLPLVDRNGRLRGVVALDDVLALEAHRMGSVADLLWQTSPQSLWKD